MNSTKKILIFTAIFSALIPFNVFARTNVYDWYIKNFDSEIIVNKDSSLLITEKITADCGNAYDKHGIFRILPTQIKTAEGTIKNPVELISITDFNDKPLKYTTNKDSLDHTITWKIGDANITVHGVNYYKIVYRVKNAIRFQNPDFDELYWNLNGNFWDLETDSFIAKIIFPNEVNQNNTQIDYYTGALGSKSKNLAAYKWLNDNTLEFSSTKTLMRGEGITASITFPKGIFTPYKLSFMEEYGHYMWFLIPLLVFIVCFYFWSKYGKDPRIDKTIIPEYEIPENLTPLETGLIMTNGSLRNEFISAAIINMAVKGMISIEEIKTKFLLTTQKDFKLKRLVEIKQNTDDKLMGMDMSILMNMFVSKISDKKGLLISDVLGSAENILLSGLFGQDEEVLLSSLKYKFSGYPSMIKEATMGNLQKNGLITKKGFTLQGLFLIIGIFSLIPVLPIFASSNIILAGSLAISGIIFIIFSFVMPKRTEKGAELLWKIEGFKLYMETAEKYRQQFNEKENIFEKFLPYAMVFGITDLWIKKMKEIYGEQYFNTYVPAWYIGTNIGSFNVDSFNSALDSISSSIASNVGSSSGAGGGGGSGGGGGGGGGGGW